MNLFDEIARVLRVRGLERFVIDANGRIGFVRPDGSIYRFMDGEDALVWLGLDASTVGTVRPAVVRRWVCICCGKPGEPAFPDAHACVACWQESERMQDGMTSGRAP